MSAEDDVLQGDNLEQLAKNARNPVNWLKMTGLMTGFTGLVLGLWATTKKGKEILGTFSIALDDTFDGKGFKWYDASKKYHENLTKEVINESSTDKQQGSPAVPAKSAESQQAEGSSQGTQNPPANDKGNAEPNKDTKGGQSSPTTNGDPAPEDQTNDEKSETIAKSKAIKKLENPVQAAEEAMVNEAKKLKENGVSKGAEASNGDKQPNVAPKGFFASLTSGWDHPY